jgi:predicted O-methyltransferase YrrM
VLKYQTNLLQDLTEFNRFLALIREQQVRSYLEIGSKHGGSFWRISTSLPKGSRVVSVDLPHGDGSFKESQPHLEACAKHLKADGYDAHLFIGDSTDLTIVEKVRKLGPFDLVFIDANHTEPYVSKDWENYRGMSNIIAFHDIGFVALPHKAPPKKLPIDVPKFWNRLKKDHKHIEIRCCPASNGIGVLWQA